MPAGRRLDNVFNNGSKKSIKRTYNAKSAGVFFVILSEPVGEAFLSKKDSEIDAAIKYFNFFDPVENTLKIDNFKGDSYEFTDSENFHYKAASIKPSARSYVNDRIGSPARDFSENRRDWNCIGY